jgi:hypothetical protein
VRFAVVGAGLAGVATAWHLIQVRLATLQPEYAAGFCALSHYCQEFTHATSSQRPMMRAAINSDMVAITLSITPCALQQASKRRPVEVHLYDMQYISAGASGAAAGLLHPFNPKGKVT